MPDPVTFEGQNAVFRLLRDHTGVLAGNGPANPRVLGKLRYRACRIKIQNGHQSYWRHIRVVRVVFSAKTRIFFVPFIIPLVWLRFGESTYIFSESPE